MAWKIAANLTKLLGRLNFLCHNSAWSIDETIWNMRQLMIYVDLKYVKLMPQWQLHLTAFTLETFLATSSIVQFLDIMDRLSFGLVFLASKTCYREPRPIGSGNGFAEWRPIKTSFSSGIFFLKIRAGLIIKAFVMINLNDLCYGSHGSRCYDTR